MHSRTYKEVDKETVKEVFLSNGWNPTEKENQLTKDNSLVRFEDNHFYSSKNEMVQKYEWFDIMIYRRSNGAEFMYLIYKSN